MKTSRSKDLTPNGLALPPESFEWEPSTPSTADSVTFNELQALGSIEAASETRTSNDEDTKG
jgi:hypothetical protein